MGAWNTEMTGHGLGQLIGSDELRMEYPCVDRDNEDFRLLIATFSLPSVCHPPLNDKTCNCVRVVVRG
jgi:hypothetical protein